MAWHELVPRGILERLRERSPAALAIHATGPDSQEVQSRRARANLLKPARRTDTLKLLLAQFKSPIIIILLFAARLSFFFYDQADTLISEQLDPTVWSSFVRPHTRSHAGGRVP